MTKEINAMEQFFIKYLKDDDVAANGIVSGLNFKTCRVTNPVFLEAVKGDKFKVVEAEFSYYTNHHSRFKAIPNPNGECALTTGILSVRTDDSLTQFVVQIYINDFIIRPPYHSTSEYNYITISNKLEYALGSSSLAAGIRGWCANK